MAVVMIINTNGGSKSEALPRFGTLSADNVGTDESIRTKQVTFAAQAFRGGSFMWILTVVCLVFSVVFSTLSVVRGVTAEKRYRKTSWDMWQRRNTTATGFLVVALALALVGVVNGHFNGQEFASTANLVIGGVWLTASVYRVRWFIHDETKALVKVIIG